MLLRSCSSYYSGLLLLLGRALLPDYSRRLYTGVATILQFLLLWPTSPPWTRAPSRLLTRLYTGVATILQFLLLWPTSPPWTRAPSRLLTTAIHRCCYDPAVPTSLAYFSSFGRALLPDYSHGYTQVLLRSCSSYFSGLLLLLWTRAPSRLLTRLYTGVATILQFLLLWPTSPPLDARSFQTTHTAIHRCCYDPAVPTSLAYFSSFGRALLPDYSHGYTQVLLRSCSSYFSGLLLLLWTRAPSRLLTRLYTGVATILQFLLLWPTSPPLDARSFQTTHTAIHRCCYDPAVPTSLAYFSSFGRALLPDYSQAIHRWMLDCLGTVLSYSQGVLRSCSSYFLAYFSSLDALTTLSLLATSYFSGRARSFQTTHTAIHRCCYDPAVPTSLAYFSSLDARSFQTTHDGYTQVLLRSCSSYFSGLLLLLGRALLPDYSRGYTQVLLRSCSSYFSGLLLLLWTRAPSRLLTRLYTGVATILQFLLLWPTSPPLDARSFQTTHTAIHRCCYDPAVPTSLAYFSSFGRALLPDYSHGYTQVLLRSCSSYFSGLLLLLWTRAPSRLLTRLYTGVATILQFLLLWPTSPPLDARSFQTTHTAIHRCCYDPAVPTSLAYFSSFGRALLPDYSHGYTQVLLRSCSSYYSGLLLLLWTRAPSRLLTRLSQVLLRSCSSYSLAYFSSFGRALLPDYSHGYTQVLLRSCSSYFSGLLLLLWTRAPSRLLTRLYTGVATILQFLLLWPTSPPLDARSFQTTHNGYHRCCYDPAVPTTLAYFSSFGRALLPDYSHGYTQVDT